MNNLSVETLSQYFVSHRIILPAEQIEIFNAHSPIKAAGLLLSKISSALNVGVTESFYKFLAITEQYGTIDSKTVTTAMRKKLKCNGKGTMLLLAVYIHIAINV